MKKILLIGANGMFGQDAASIFSSAGYEVYQATRADFDITNAAQVEKFFSDKVFDFVVNSAAYTKVDDAEKEQEQAFAVNAVGAKNVAEAAAQKNIPVIFISTDYVFDGTKNSLYLPTDSVNPQTVYGSSKLAGEENVKAVNPRHYVVRTSWLYGQYGKNFVDTMLNLAKTQPSLKVVNDQFGCPTWTCDLAEGLLKLMSGNYPFGTYQLCGSGVTSWYDFAQKIFEFANLRVSVLPVTTEEFPRPAPRPKYSAMDNQGFCRDWQSALQEYLKSKES